MVIHVKYRSSLLSYMDMPDEMLPLTCYAYGHEYGPGLGFDAWCLLACLLAYVHACVPAVGFFVE